MVFLRDPDGDAGARPLHLRRLHLRLPHLHPGVEVSWVRGHNQELGALTPQSLNVKLGPRSNYHKGRVV